MHFRLTGVLSSAFHGCTIPVLLPSPWQFQSYSQMCFSSIIVVPSLIYCSDTLSAIPAKNQ